MAYHPTTDTIAGILRENNCRFERFEHEPVKTSEEASRVRPEYSLHQGAKALILRVKKEGISKFAMFVIPGDARLDKNKIKELGFRDFRFALENEISEITQGIQIGGIPPFGNLFNLEVFCDPEVLKNEKIIFNAGDRSVSIGMYSGDYQKLVNPQVVPLV